MKNSYDSLVGLPGMDIGLADVLYESGVYSAEELSRCGVEDLLHLRDMTEEVAQGLINAAQWYLKEKSLEAKNDKAEESTAASGDEAGNTDGPSGQPPGVEGFSGDTGETQLPTDAVDELGGGPS
jgi:transcription termination factor NusA